MNAENAPNTAQPAAPAPEPEPIPMTAEDFQAEWEFPMVFRPGRTIRVRRLDIVTMVLSGVVPQDMLATATQMENAWAEARSKGASGFQAIMAMPTEERDAVITMLREYCTHAMVQPPASWPDDAGRVPPGHVNVLSLTVPDMLRIQNALPPVGSQVPPANVPAPLPINPPLQTPEQVDRFREGQPRFTGTPVVRRDGIPYATVVAPDGHGGERIVELTRG